MHEITIDKLQPGMVLARAAVHLNGRVLLEAGETIAPKHLRMLKAWGVYSAVVEGAADDAGAEAAGSAFPRSGPGDADHDALVARFRHTDLSHPVIAELFRFRLRKAP